MRLSPQKGPVVSITLCYFYFLICAGMSAASFYMAIGMALLGLETSRAQAFVSECVGLGIFTGFLTLHFLGYILVDELTKSVKKFVPAPANSREVTGS